MEHLKSNCPQRIKYQSKYERELLTFLSFVVTNEFGSETSKVQLLASDNYTFKLLMENGFMTLSRLCCTRIKPSSH